MKFLVRASVRAVRFALRASVLPWKGRGPHLTRFRMYAEIRAAFPEPHRHSEKKVLSISGSEALLNALALESFQLTKAEYPAQNILDLNDSEDKSFDVVVSDQVLEHVEGEPTQAVDEMLRVTRSGGVVVTTTCFLNPLHYGPKDLWRFSPEGLQQLFEGKARILHVGAWGSIPALMFLALGLRHLSVPPAWHPVGRIARRSQTPWPISTWIIVEKV